MPEGFDLAREMLKWVAIITMTIDHIGAILYPQHVFLRVIGRFAFPLFSYLIVLGVQSTKNVRNYFIRLFVFAVISQIPYYLARGFKPFDSFNIFFTLCSGVLFIQFIKQNPILTMVPLLASVLLPFDYSVYGIATIGCLYILNGNTKIGIASLVLLNLLFAPIWPTQVVSLLALPIILLHRYGYRRIMREVDGKTAYPLWRKYMYYIYYPFHLTVLYIIKSLYF